MFLSIKMRHVGFILLIFSILFISLSSASAYTYDGGELNITPNDRDNREVISNTIGSGNVSKFNIEEGEYDWLGQLNISNSMDITFKGNTKISNNNNSITTLFNLKGNTSDYIKININGYGSSSNPFGVKINGYVNPIYGEYIDSLTLSYIELNINTLEGDRSDAILLNDFNDVTIDYVNFIHNLVDNSDIFNTAINLNKHNSNGKRSKINISNSFFENWDSAILIETPVDFDSDIYDIFIERNNIANTPFGININTRGNIVLRNNALFNNIEYIYSNSNILTNEGNISIDNLTVNGSSVDLHAYNGNIKANNIDLKYSNGFYMDSTNGITLTNVNISDFSFGIQLYSANGLILLENITKTNSFGGIDINNENGSVYLKNVNIYNPDIDISSDGISIYSQNGTVLIENCSIIGVSDSNPDFPQYNIRMPFQINVAGSNVIIRNSKAVNYDGPGLYFTWTNYFDNYNYLYTLIENFHLINGSEGHYIMVDSVFGNLTIKNSSIRNMTSGGLNYDIQNYPNMESNLLIDGLLVENVYCGVTITAYGNDASGSIIINNLTYRNSISPFDISAHNFFVSLNNSLVQNVSQGVNFHIHFFDDTNVPRYLKVNNFTIDTINETDVAWTLNMMNGIAELNKVAIKNIVGECNCFATGLDLYLTNSTAYVSNSIFNNITGYGIHLEQIDETDFNNGHRLFVSRSNFTNIGYSDDFCCPLEGAGILTHNGLVVEDNCNFIGNKNGIVIDCSCGDGVNNIIKGSNFLNNTNFGVVVGYGGANNIINFNRFVDNGKAAIYLGESSYNNNLNSNWFGRNNITGQVIGFTSNNDPSTNAQYTLVNWFITTLSADKGKFLSNETNVIRYKMGLTTDGVNIYDLTQTTNLPDFLTTMNFYKNGSLYYSETFAANTAEYLISMKFAAGNYTVNSITDYQINNLTFESVQVPINPTDPDPNDPDPVDPNPIDPIDPNNNGSPIANASMKETGMPFLAILLVLITSLGLFVRRK